MTPAIAARLGAEPGDPAIRTAYTFMGNGEAVTLSVSWEPATLTTGTPIVFPEEGPNAGRGVVERMAVIGQQITHAEETVAARAEPPRFLPDHVPGAVAMSISSPSPLRHSSTCHGDGEREPAAFASR
jgi:hypothetical protein